MAAWVRIAISSWGCSLHPIGEGIQRAEAFLGSITFNQKGGGEREGGQGPLKRVLFWLCNWVVAESGLLLRHL